MKQWLMRCLSSKPVLTAEQQQRLLTWQMLPAMELQKNINDSRYVVVDVETTGLNLMQDKLISIGAVAVVHGKIEMGDSFYVVLKQQMASDKGNILVHGISDSVQREGMPVVDALLDFLEYLGKSPLIAFHVTFDETMIKRAIRDYLGCSFKHAWLDMAYVMPSLNPSLASKYRALDEWVGHFNIENDARHNALADALVTAQLFQVAQSQAFSKGGQSFKDLMDLEKAQRWISGVS